VFHVQAYKKRNKMNISTDKLINETNQLTYKLHIISLKIKIVLKSLFHYKKTTLELKRTYSISNF